MSVKVKICGLTRLIDVTAAVASGADSLGFIFGYPDSPRNLSFRRLKKIISEIPPLVSTVIVTPSSNKDLEKIIELAPSYIQLYDGMERPRKIRYPNVIQTVRPVRDSRSTIAKTIHLAKNSRAILFDGSSTSRYSKKEDMRNGITLEESWETARVVNRALSGIPLILSGGLTADNVEKAIRLVRPYAVDVSSGVESSPGVKDGDKIFRFVRNAKKKASDST